MWWAGGQCRVRGQDKAKDKAMADGLSQPGCLDILQKQMRTTEGIYTEELVRFIFRKITRIRWVGGPEWSLPCWLLKGAP